MPMTGMLFSDWQAVTQALQPMQVLRLMTIPQAFPSSAGLAEPEEADGCAAGASIGCPARGWAWVFGDGIGESCSEISWTWASGFWAKSGSFLNVSIDACRTSSRPSMLS